MIGLWDWVSHRIIVSFSSLYIYIYNNLLNFQQGEKSNKSSSLFLPALEEKPQGLRRRQLRSYDGMPQKLVRSDGYWRILMDINGLWISMACIAINYIYIYIHSLNQLPWDISNNDAYEWILPFPQCYIPPYLWSQCAYIPYYGTNMCKFPT